MRGVDMARRRRRGASAGVATGTLSELRKQAQSVMKRLRRAGERQLAAIETQINKLNKQRQVLMDELTSAVSGGRGGGRRGRGAASAGRGGRRGRRSRVDWDKVY